VMFGYLLIAKEGLYGRYPLINDHPALPDGPVGTYQEVIAELMRTGAEESGCMINMVTGDVDRGPVLSYCRYPLRDVANEGLWAGLTQDDLASREAIEATALYADIRARGVQRERPFLVETLRAVAEGSLPVPPAEAVDLTDAVEETLKRGQ
jgi:phosphoribosylglycinamide formyltransferase 1